jgi:hypothetical protein
MRLYMHGGTYIRGGGGVSYIRNGIRVSEYGGLIHGVLYWRGGGLIFGGLRYMFSAIPEQLKLLHSFQFLCS